MRRTPRRFLSSLARLVGPPIMMFAPMVAAHTHSNIAVPASATTAADPTGMTITVTNCNDRGPGSLRAAVAGALSGDTIDMTGLACRRINLTSGAIMIPQDDLTLRGGGGMTVDANRLSSVFRHSGTGWLRIRGMTIARGFYQSDATQVHGGCVYSAGSVELANSLVHWCRVRATRWGYDVYALGGGLYAAGAVTLRTSQVIANTAEHTNPVSPDHSQGGGIYALGRLTARHSRICGNHGGGVVANDGLHANYTTFSNNNGSEAIKSYQDTVIANSTISGNNGRGWALDVDYYRPGSMIEIINSTISGNTSGVAAVRLSGSVMSIVNSTIVFNQHDLGHLCPFFGAVYFTANSYEDGGPLHLESTIVANNSCNGRPYRDIYDDVDDNFGVNGANNLITSSNVPLPPDTISVDPRLAPLASNGGRTRTHALLDDSPAIDMGNNAAGLAYDQRGSGFPRVNGPQADIGAYER